MNPEEGLKAWAKVQRRYAEALAWNAHYERAGGWLGRDELIRFLMFFDYTYEKQLMSEERFTDHWPHHFLMMRVWPDCN